MGDLMSLHGTGIVRGSVKDAIWRLATFTAPSSIFSSPVSTSRVMLERSVKVLIQPYSQASRRAEAFLCSHSPQHLDFTSLASLMQSSL